LSKYDGLDPRKELEQKISSDLKSAFEKRGFTVKHNGTEDSPAPGGHPDIELWTNNVQIGVEVTISTKSSSDREMPTITAHLNEMKQKNPAKSCYMIYASPETHYRMINGLMDYNQSKKSDQIVIPIKFSTLELLLDRLSTSHKSLYPEKQITRVFTRHNEYINDDNVLRIIYEELFPTDTNLKKDIENKEALTHAEIEQNLFNDLKTIENRLRESGIATATRAVSNMIYLVFVKLYEEKMENENGKNYFTSKNFTEFQEAQGQKKTKKAIHKLFEQIRDDPEFQASKLFTKTDVLAEKLDDDFVLKEVITPLEKYRFYVTKVDGLGAAYEVLALRSSKDTRVGQFFTPKHVVQFMTKLAELESTETVLDPACGTGRFLIWAMDEMLSKVSGKDVDETKKTIRETHLFGSDFDPNVAKLAKMNMYIHKDGKTNIWDDDGLLLYKTRNLDNTIDVILTNPPLGKMNYSKSPEYDDDFYKRMTVIPRNEGNITGTVMKGGALFVNACKYYLKDVRDQNAPLEWRGGKLLTILDEGILNTDDYRDTRSFIRRNFYVKAVISLTTDTFIPVSKTPTKTSILYAIKKDDPTAIQKEPTFYGYASKVGIDTKKRPCPNHLLNEDGKDLFTEYMKFKKLVLSCYGADGFNQEKFKEVGWKAGNLAED